LLDASLKHLIEGEVPIVFGGGKLFSHGEVSDALDGFELLPAECIEFGLQFFES
jgi:hypothetical protein